MCIRIIHAQLHYTVVIVSHFISFVHSDIIIYMNSEVCVCVCVCQLVNALPHMIIQYS